MDCDLFQGDRAQSELDAYLLGFFYADGCVRKNTFSIALAEKDQGFLQWILDILNNTLSTTCVLKYNGKTKSYKFTISNRNFVEKLIRYGIVEHKTYENNDFVFKNIPHNLKWHFIRGYFDGDGSICYASGSNKWTSNIVSLNKTLIHSIRDYCFQYINHGTVRNDKQYSRFCLSGNKCVTKFGEMMYKDAHYFMERKREKFESIPTYRKNNIYNGITNYHNKYRVDIYSKQNKKQIYLGLCNTVAEAVNLYNSYCEKCDQQKQEYKGEELYYE